MVAVESKSEESKGEKDTWNVVSGKGRHTFLLEDRPLPTSVESQV